MMGNLTSQLTGGLLLQQKNNLNKESEFAAKILLRKSYETSQRALTNYYIGNDRRHVCLCFPETKHQGRSGPL